MVLIIVLLTEITGGQAGRKLSDVIGFGLIWRGMQAWGNTFVNETSKAEGETQRQITILVLDDDQRFRALLAELLAEQGYLALRARNGAEAKAFIAAGPVDLAIVDYRLPDTDGMTWIMELRESHNDMPIVFLSGFFSDYSTFLRLRNVLKVAHVLHKPIVPELFIEQLEQVLKETNIKESIAQEAASRQVETEISLGSAAYDTGTFGSSWLQNLKQAAASEKDEVIYMEAHPSTEPKAFLETDKGEAWTDEEPPSFSPAQKADLFGQGSPKTSLLQRLATLRQEYEQELPGLLDEIHQAINNAREKSNPAELKDLAQKIIDCAHKVRGTSGSLGFLLIGECAGKIEDILRQAKEQAASLSQFSIEPEVWDDAECEAIKAQSGMNMSSILIPQTASEVASSTLKESEAEPSATFTPILVCDPDSTFCDTLSEFGRRRHIALVGATNAKEAVQKAKESCVEAVIINSKLEAEKPTLSKQLRQALMNEKLPIAFVSDSAQLDEHVKAAQARALLFLEKPLNAESFDLVLRKLLTSRTGDKYRVLVIDDDERLCQFVRTILENEGMVVKYLTDPTQVMDCLADFCPDVVLLDLNMPFMSGFDICRMLRTSPRWQDLSIVCLTGKAGVRSRVAAFKAGVDDYLTKPFTNEDLITRVKTRIERARLIHERLSSDSMCGVLSGDYFLEQLKNRVNEAKIMDTSLTVTVLTISDYRAIVKSHGLTFSRSILASLGQLLLTHFSSDDLRGHWQAEHFVLAFAGKDLQDRSAIQSELEKVKAEFGTISFIGKDQMKFNCSLDFTLAQFPQDGQTAEDLIDNAARQLYKVKVIGS
jgi:DNA-binding response OmpR family regulator/HPt (histidine-containing phosphotransfer) domain-containing protein